MVVLELTCSTLESNALEVNVNACSAPIPPATDYHPLLITSLHYTEDGVYANTFLTYKYLVGALVFGTYYST